MSFVELATIFADIEKIQSRNEMMHMLAELFTKLTPHEAKIVSYLVLGTLNPPYISTQFNIADKSMKVLVARLVKKDIEDISDEIKKEGDAGAVIANYTWHYSHKLSIEQVYEALVHIEQISGTGSQEEKSNQLEKLLLQVSSNAAKYIVRIVLGKLRLGFSDMTLLDAFSWMLVQSKKLKNQIEAAYNNCVDIGLVAYHLVEGGIDGIKDIQVTLGVPIRPASAERLASAEDIFTKLGHCVAQLKLDGFRVQIHIDKSKGKKQVNFFSRHLNDMSDMFPDLIIPLLDLPVETVICEGEAICYDANTGNFLPFQETVKRRRKHGIEKAATEYPLQVYLFDVLYLNGHEVMSKPHYERRALLEKICINQTDDSVVQVIQEKKIENAKALQEYFLSAIDQGLEGLVVKRPDAVYQAGKRNFNWIKLKRSQGGQLRDTLDCVILGYYAGRGRRAQFGIGAFLVGLYNAAKDEFETIAKIGTGLKDDQWIDLKQKCDAISVQKKPKEVICPKELYPDVWVDPQIVCEIYADEITISPTHTAGKTEQTSGYALRFPRFLQYREDKGANETTTVKELKELYKIQF